MTRLILNNGALIAHLTATGEPGRIECTRFEQHGRRIKLRLDLHDEIDPAELDTMLGSGWTGRDSEIDAFKASVASGQCADPFEGVSL